MKNVHYFFVFLKNNVHKFSAFNITSPIPPLLKLGNYNKKTRNILRFLATTYNYPTLPHYITKQTNCNKMVFKICTNLCKKYLKS